MRRITLRIVVFAVAVASFCVLPLQGASPSLLLPLLLNQRALEPSPTASPTPIDGTVAPPTITPTASSTATPTRTPVPTIPTPLYFDDFSDPGSGWWVVDYPYSSTAYVNGEYQILLKALGKYQMVDSGFRCHDCAVEVDARFASSQLGVYGLLFGLAKDWDTYMFNVNGVQEYSLYSKVSDDWQTLVEWTFSPHINRGGETNHLRVERKGPYIGLYVNGRYLTAVDDSSLMGLFGVGLQTASSNSAYLDARFDNFAVYPVASGAAPPVLR